MKMPDDCRFMCSLHPMPDFSVVKCLISSAVAALLHLGVLGVPHEVFASQSSDSNPRSEFVIGYSRQQTNRILQNVFGGDFRNEQSSNQFTVGTWFRNRMALVLNYGQGNVVTNNSTTP